MLVPPGYQDDYKIKKTKHKNINNNNFFLLLPFSDCIVILLFSCEVHKYYLIVDEIYIIIQFRKQTKMFIRQDHMILSSCCCCCCRSLFSLVILFLFVCFVIPALWLVSHLFVLAGQLQVCQNQTIRSIPRLPQETWPSIGRRRRKRTAHEMGSI